MKKYAFLLLIIFISSCASNDVFIKATNKVFKEERKLYKKVRYDNKNGSFIEPLSKTLKKNKREEKIIVKAYKAKKLLFLKKDLPFYLLRSTKIEEPTTYVSIFNSEGNYSFSFYNTELDETEGVFISEKTKKLLFDWDLKKIKELDKKYNGFHLSTIEVTKVTIDLNNRIRIDDITFEKF